MYNTKVIELMGLPATGKTTTAQALVKHFKNFNKKVSVVEERIPNSPIKDKLDPIINHWNANVFERQYIEAVASQVDILIVDRGLVDSMIWVDCLSEITNQVDLFSLYVDSMTHGWKKIMMENYAGLFFNAPIETVLQRDKARQIKARQGRIMNADVLSRYIKSYKKLKYSFDFHLGHKIRISEVDSSYNNITKLVKSAAKNIDTIL